MKKKEKKQKVQKKHPVRRTLGMIFASLFMVLTVVVNVAVTAFGGIIDGFIGAPTADVEAETVKATTDSAKALAEEVEAQSVVLLQNKDEVLPLSKDVTKVNVFGWASSAWLGGGSGSGGVNSVEYDFLQSLTNYGIEYNTELSDMYKDFKDGRDYAALSSTPEQFNTMYEPSISDTNYYSEQMLQNALDYSDTAFVVLGRIGGESNDCTQEQYKVTEKEGSVKVDDSRTYLDLSTEEEELLTYVGANYDKVIVVINTANVMTLGEMETISGIDAVIDAGLSGQNGANAIPKVLWGDISPSGKTADTWAYDFASAASYANSGMNGVGAYTNTDGLYPADGTTNGNLGETQAYTQVSYLDYAENIYVGYKWYETADAEGFWNDVYNEYGIGYDGIVQYPFGYGLSYTSFEWEVTDAPEDEDTLLKDGEVSYTVKVTNKGSMAWQDIVELYYSAPYIPGQIEKSAIVLGGFEKTDILQPGESQEVTITVSVADMASYDCYDSNANGFSGYELDAGDYIFTLRRDAHTVDTCEKNTVTLTSENIQYPEDPVTGNAVHNKFTGKDAVDGVSLDGTDAGQNITYLTRADFAGTFPYESVKSRELGENAKALNLYTSEMADAWIDETDEPITTGADNGLTIENNGVTTELGYELGADFNDEKWDELLDQMSVEEMENLVLHGYGKTAAVKSIGKILCKDADGPSQIGGFTGMGAGTGFPSASTLAMSWNTELALQMGRIIGQQAIQNGYGGWYAPATNLHRSPFNGRNFEYYSEDSILSGELCGNTVQGAAQLGVYTYVKHFICNDGESGIYRDSVYLWMTEQALREIYLKPFQIIVEKYDGVGLMSSYNRIGAVWSGGSEALLMGVLRDEWGFNGAVITDYSDHHVFMNGDQSLRAGGTIWMDGAISGILTCETESNSFMQRLRSAAKEALYMYLHVRVVNRDYAVAVGDDSLLRPSFSPSIISAGRIALVFDVLAVLFMVLAIRGIVIEVKVRKALKKAKTEV